LILDEYFVGDEVKDFDELGLGMLDVGLEKRCNGSDVDMWMKLLCSLLLSELLPAGLVIFLFFSGYFYEHYDYSYSYYKFDNTY
jgi:hypothetical protein